jgi:hypothetical protein
VAYWYADQVCRAAKVPPVLQRLPVTKNHSDEWIKDKKRQITSRVIKPNKEMLEMKAKWAREHQARR